MPPPPDNLVGRRIKALREDRGLTQAQLADALGLPHRQTLGAIESGERSITSEELARAADVLEVDLSAFTDPFRLIGEGSFSFRAGDVTAEVLDDFQGRAGRWIATYRTLRDRAGVPRTRLSYKLDLQAESRYEEAHASAEELRLAWGMGDTPASVLVGTIEKELEARVLYVDAPDGVSGAAVHLPGLNAILVHRREPLGRRHFDIAHELFHLLTWDAMQPDRVEPREVTGGKGKRVERLAENFAGALLMPESMVARHWAARGDMSTDEWLRSVASTLGVTAVALKWRLVVLGHLTKAEAMAIDDRSLVDNGADGRALPLLFDREFVERVHAAVDAGRLSLRRALDILGLNAPDFSRLCDSYGLTLSYEV